MDTYYSSIKNKIIDNEIYSKVKDYSKERHKVITYFEIGKLLYEAGNKYGDNVIDKYSKKLTLEVGKKYNERTLRRIRQYYLVFKDKKWSPVATKLSWSHYTELLPIKDCNKLMYYINVCINLNLTRNELRNKIKSKEYERLPNEAKNKLLNNEYFEIKDFIPNPILIKNKNNIEINNEKVLHQLILENIEMFMKELGTSFCFIGSEYKIKIGDRYNYIDLLFFNINYNSYVVIELKITELKKEYIGQIHTYMNYIDTNLKTINHNNTIGIIICKKDNKFIMEYCSDSRILSREYQLI